jgi:hypothetical protein
MGSLGTSFVVPHWKLDSFDPSAAFAMTGDRALEKVQAIALRVAGVEISQEINEAIRVLLKLNSID